MKHFKRILALLLALALLSVPAFAARTASGWAEAEIARAGQLGLLDCEGVPEDLTRPVTRAEFRALAMQYLAVGSRCDADTFRSLLVETRAERNPDGTVKPAFTDGTEADSLAFYAGLVLGDGDGRFRPDDTITRQEVSVMLLRAGALLGAALPAAALPDFTDAAEIAGWAADAVGALADAGVVLGHDDGSFDPDGLCTVEQTVAMLLRLYDGTAERATPLFTAAQCRAWLDDRLEQNGLTRTHSLLAEGPQAELIREETNGVMRAVSAFYLLYRGGGLVCLDLGVQNTAYGPTAAMALESPAFSDDGAVFTCKVTIAGDVVSDGAVLCEKGVWALTLRLDDPYHVSAVKQ